MSLWPDNFQKHTAPNRSILRNTSSENASTISIPTSLDEIQQKLLIGVVTSSQTIWTPALEHVEPTRRLLSCRVSYQISSEPRNIQRPKKLIGSNKTLYNVEKYELKPLTNLLIHYKFSFLSLHYATIISLYGANHISYIIDSSED
jgi:hypothetical protein